MVQRCSEFVLAKEAFERVVDSELENVVGDLSCVESNFVRWMDKYRAGRFVRLVGCDDFVFIRMFNRFMDVYVDRAKRQLKGLFAGQWDLMLTLTMKPLGLLSDEFAYVGKQFPRVRAWLFKRFGHFSYFKILEITKVGRPHLHVLVRLSDLCKRGVPLDWLRIETESLYSEGVDGKLVLFQKGLRDVWGFFVKVRRCWDGFRASSYCMKYLFKTLESRRGFDLMAAGLLFASNMRMFGMSQDLRAGWRSNAIQGMGSVVASERPPVSPPTLPKRKFEGTGSWKSFEEFAKVKGLDLSRDLWVVPKGPDLHMMDFPAVFGVNE